MTFGKFEDYLFAMQNQRAAAVMLRNCGYDSMAKMLEDGAPLIEEAVWSFLKANDKVPKP